MTDDTDCPFENDGGPSFGAMGLIKTLVDMGMCKDCAMRLAPLIYADDQHFAQRVVSAGAAVCHAGA